MRGIRNVRYLILALIFSITVVNYADRSIISIAGSSIADELRLSAVTMGYIFSAFGWSYVLAQLPGGWVLDRFGSKAVYTASIALWSMFTLLQGAAGFLAGGAAVALLFGLRLLVGLAEAPSFPANSRVVAAWFPATERGFASSVFNSGQYFSTVIFAPFMAWIVHAFGWQHVFWVMGIIGLAMAVLWASTFHAPRRHPLIQPSELEQLVAGGALLDIDAPPAAARGGGPGWSTLKQLLSNRMLLGIYGSQYCITTLTYFFLTWLPVYLVKARGFSILDAGLAATLPALCGFFGSILGGIISDRILKATGSLTLARKIPIVAGMLLSMLIVLCNYVETPAAVVGLVAVSFFGKGVGALGWTVVADTSPTAAAGLSASLFNTFGNVAGITTPIAIGYLVQGSGGSFEGALIFVAINALVALASYLFIVGEIRRVSLRQYSPADR